MPEFLQSNFNGEWSPLMLGRVDLARYATSVRTMENFTPTITGGARKRPGLEYVGEVADSTKKTRLESFTFSEEQTYLFEFGDLTLRIWKDGALVNFGTPSAPNYVITTHYTEDEIFNIRMTSTNDVIYLACGDHPPYQLIRNSETDWEFSQIEFENQPYADENLKEVFISSSATTGNGVTLTATTSLSPAPKVFYDGMENGTVFKISHFTPREFHASSSAHTNDNTTLITNFSPATTYSVGDKFRVTVSGEYFYYTCYADYTGGSGTGASPEDHPDYFYAGIEALSISDNSPLQYYVEGEWNFRTEGTWDGEWAIQESDDGIGDSWSTRYAMPSTNSDNYVREGDETGSPVYLRVVLYRIKTLKNHQVHFTLSEVEKYGEAEITSVNESAQTATANIVTHLYSTAQTRHWSENEWSGFRGYPKLVFFKNNRLCFASTKSDNQAIWGSEVDKWDNFGRGILTDTEPFKDVLRTGNQDPIEWVSEQSQTLLGLSSQIRNYTKEDGSSILAPGKNASVRQAGRGAAYVEPVEVDDFTFYVQQGGRIIRGLSNDYERGVFAAPDMTREAEHVTKGGVIQMGFQLNRLSTLYAVTGAGEVACLIFEPEMEKMGWYRLTTQTRTNDEQPIIEQSIIESVAVLPSTGEEDDVYFVVKRTINGNTVRYIEKLAGDQMRAQEDGEKIDMFYVDCGVTIEQTTTTFTAAHLKGQKIQVIGDGDYLGEFDVDSTTGEVTIPQSNKVVYGLQIVSSLWPMPLEGLTQTGTTSGSKKRVKEITVDVFNSYGLKAKESPYDTNEAIELIERDTSVPLNNSPSLFTGKLEVRTALPRSYDGNVFYQSDVPFGVFIRNIITKWEKTS